MTWQKTYCFIGLVLLVVLALTDQPCAAVGRSTDDDQTVTVYMKPSGEQEIFRQDEGRGQYWFYGRQLPLNDGKPGQALSANENGDLVWKDQPQKEWFVDQQGVYRPSETTNITVLPPPVIQAAPEPQDSRIQTTVDGIDHIETKAILPESLVVDQLDAVKKIADNGAVIAQQRFAVEQYKINSEAGLEYLRIVKSFILWGFILSIPFLGTVYWIFKQIAVGLHHVQEEKLDYKLKELESSERIVRGE